MSFELHGDHEMGFQIREGDRVVCEIDDEDDAKRLFTFGDGDPANDQQHLLMILAEECSELAKEALKAARFDLDRAYGRETNRERIVTEFSDIMAVAIMLGIKYRPARICEKRRKVRKAMKLSSSLGML